MGDAKLMTRIDTKFVAPRCVLSRLIEMMGADYRVLEIDGRRVMNYYTCYFDTPGREMYHEHQRGRKARQKVRIRRYEDGDGLEFLEVKDKNNKGKTHKSRLELTEDVDHAMRAAFIAEKSRYTCEGLRRQVENRFERITLVGRGMAERITIDSSLRFRNLVMGHTASLPDTAVIEWKHSALSEASPLKGMLRELRIQESGFSKYCMGMACTDPALLTGRIKQKLRTVAKLSAVPPTRNI